MASLFTGTTDVNKHVLNASDLEKRVNQLTLDQLEDQAALSDLYSPILKGQIQDMLDEQTVRGGGTLTDPTRQKKFTDLIAGETDAQASAARMNEINTQLAEANLKSVQQGGRATAEQAALIDETTAAAQSAGEADIDRFRTDTLRRINEEVASASGLRPTDTPVVRLSERAGEEAARQHGILTSNLRGANANAKLNFPLAASSLTSTIASNQQNLGLASENFAQTLAQRAQDNRYRLFAANPTNTFGTSGANFSGTLSGFRANTANTTQNSTPSLLGQISNVASGVGGAISAIGGLFSDRRLKRDIYRVGEYPSGLPIYAFRFHGFEDWHMGVMADEVLEVQPEAVSVHESGYLQVRYDLLQ